MQLDAVLPLAKRYVWYAITLVCGVIVGSGVSLAVVSGNSPGNTATSGEVQRLDSAGLDGLEEEHEEQCLDGFWVNVSGEVVEPGVYCVKAGAIMREAIEKSGGFAETVCERWVEREFNGAGVVEPNSKLFVPGREDAECMDPAVVAQESGAVAPGSGAVPVGSVSTGFCHDGRVNINKASLAELETLSGVGPSTAQKIIESRPYSKVEDLLNVSGIGEKTLEKFKDKVCV